MAAAPPPVARNDWPGNYRASNAWWSVLVLSVFQVVSMIDRQTISVLIPEMRADLALNDFQIGLVQGLAFALFYGVMGLVIGAMVDRYSRQRIMFAGVVLWSLAATGTGLARNYAELFIGRLFVGFGEAAIAPAGQSLLSSIFPRHRLTTPMACFTVSGVLGISLSYALGGNLLDRFTASPLSGPLAGLAAWRQVLVVTGLPGLAVALLAFSIREPRRRSAPPPSAEAATWGGFFRYIGDNARLMLGLVLGSSIMALAIQGTMIWTPTYARRTLGVSAAEIGTMMSVAVAVGGIVGGLSLGLFIDRRFARGARDIALRLSALFAFTVPPVVALAFLLSDFRLLFAAVTLMMMTMGACFGPTMAAVQMVVPPEMRGRFAALVVLCSNLFGFALGPMLIGFLTEYVFGDPAMIRYAIVVCLLVAGPVSGWLTRGARQDFIRRLEA
ncbi:MFS transporter [Novosphingobium endophyticum]|uniref:MFS transporter n=1 Tax=Novosphingobium endophyticum TaxID=1955250 RepID=A0A916TSM3_9SPHN|nr:MFS transporter [Novosphingobium endophyticum]GGC03427.1 MFS transporter [Novosphingobium endophyticum]